MPVGNPDWLPAPTATGALLANSPEPDAKKTTGPKMAPNIDSQQRF